MGWCEVSAEGCGFQSAVLQDVHRKKTKGFEGLAHGDIALKQVYLIKTLLNDQLGRY